MELAEAGDALGPAHVGPQHPDCGQHPEQDRQAAGGGQKLAPDRSHIQGRQSCDQPQRDENPGCRRRPGQRYGNADGEPVGQPLEADAIEAR